MDNLSVATVMAGLVGLTLELGNLLGQYGAAVKNASKDIQTLQEEFIALSYVLKQLEKFFVKMSKTGLLIRRLLFATLSVLAEIMLLAFWTS
jgi:hypothetical protein